LKRRSYLRLPSGLIVTSILLPAGDLSPNGDGEPLLNLVVDLTQADLCNVSLALTGVVEDAFTLRPCLRFLRRSRRGWPDRRQTRSSLMRLVRLWRLPPLLEGSIENLRDEVVDAALDLAGRHAAALVCEYKNTRIHAGRYIYIVLTGKKQILQELGCLDQTLQPWCFSDWLPESNHLSISA
jgi:hypothetical protein